MKRRMMASTAPVLEFHWSASEDRGSAVECILRYFFQRFAFHFLSLSELLLSSMELIQDAVAE